MKKTFLLQIGGREVECNPRFKLFLVSPDSVSSLSPLVTSLVNAVLFHPEIQGLQESTLNSFLRLQNQKTFQDRKQLRVEIHSQSVKAEEVEKELLRALVEQESSHVEDTQATKTILHLNKMYEDAMEK